MTGAFCSVSCLPLLIPCPSLFLVRLVVVVTLQSSLSRPSVPLSYNQSWSNTLKSRCVVVGLYRVAPRRSSLILLRRVVSSCFTAIAQFASSSRLTLPNTFRPIVSHYEEQVRFRLLCRVLPAGAHTLNLPRYIRCSSVITRSAFGPHFVDPDLFPVHHQPLGQGTSAVYRCQIVAHTPSACFWPTLAGSASVASQPSHWRARRSECSSSSH